MINIDAFENNQVNTIRWQTDQEFTISELVKAFPKLEYIVCSTNGLRCSNPPKLDSQPNIQLFNCFCNISKITINDEDAWQIPVLTQSTSVTSDEIKSETYSTTTIGIFFVFEPFLLKTCL